MSITKLNPKELHQMALACRRLLTQSHQIIRFTIGSTNRRFLYLRFGEFAVNCEIQAIRYLGHHGKVQFLALVIKCHLVTNFTNGQMKRAHLFLGVHREYQCAD